MPKIFVLGLDMKRITFLIIVFIFTTGFFKSALEECADIESKDDRKFNKKVETERVKLTPKESNEQRRLRKIEYDKCDVLYKKIEGQNSNIGHDICIIGAKTTYNINYKWKIIRNISPEENKKKYKKFISQSLKKKMKDRDYEESYSYCVKYKKNNPEMFKAKYD